MSDDTTNVGNITARLVLDGDQFQRDIATVTAEADRLDGRDVTVHAHADTGEAQARLAALDETQRRTNASTERGIATWQKWGMGIAAATGPAATLAAGAAGLALAFGGMGVAGIAAVVGIKREMEQGTVTGQAYSAGLASLKGNMDQLSHTGAAALLQSFDDAVQSVNGHMPALTNLTGEMASALGNIAGGTLNAFLTGLERATPLIESGAVQLSHFVGWLDSFATSQGFGDFLQYAEANLPSVVQLIESLVTLGGHLIAAFAPLGPVVVGGLQLLSDVLNALPLPVLAGVATTAVTAGTALKIMGSESVAAGIGRVATSIGLTGVAANLAVPVVGILTAALAGLAVGFASSALSQQQATVAAQDYADAVRKDNDAIGENVRQKAAQKLAEDGAAASAERQGISLKLLLDATTGNADAAKTLNAQLDDMKRRMDNAQAAGQGQSKSNAQLITDYNNLKNGVEQNSSAIGGEIEKLRILGKIRDETSSSVDTSRGAYAAYAGQLGLTSGALIAAMDAQDKQKGSADAATAAMQLENNAAGLLKQALDGLNAGHLNLEQAQTNAAKATNTVTQTFQKNGASIEGTTDAVLANQSALQQKVQADQAAASAVANATHSTEKGTAAYVDAKKQLEDNMRAQGLLTDKVQAYIDKLYDTNDFKPKPTQLDVDTSNAMTKIQALQAALDSLHGKEITNTIYNATVNSIQGGDMGTNATTNGNVRGIYALGGTVGYLAGGGMHPDARGTDIVPAMLTKNEFVIRQSSANSLRNSSPGALEYINRHGQLPPQQQAAPVINPNFQIFIGNQELDSRTYRIAQTAMEDGWADASRRRIGA